MTPGRMSSPPPMDSGLVDILYEAVCSTKNLGPTVKKWPKWGGGWPRADMAIVDAVLSPRQWYCVVKRKVLNWESVTAHRAAEELAIFRNGLALEEREILGTRNMPGTAIQRADGIIACANLLVNHRPSLRTSCDIRNYVKTKYEAREIRNLLESNVKGIGPATSAYFLMLVGVPGVKADTILTRFISAVFPDNRFSQREIEELVATCAKRFETTPTNLDYAIWRTTTRLRQMATPSFWSESG